MGEGFGDGEGEGLGSGLGDVRGPGEGLGWGLVAPGVEEVGCGWVDHRLEEVGCWSVDQVVEEGCGGKAVDRRVRLSRVLVLLFVGEVDECVLSLEGSVELEARSVVGDDEGTVWVVLGFS